MKGYQALIAARFRVLLQYRAAAVAGIGTQLFFGLIRVMIFQAFYRSSSHAQPMSYVDIASTMQMPVASIGPTRGRCLEKLRRLPAIVAIWEHP